MYRYWFIGVFGILVTLIPSLGFTVRIQRLLISFFGLGITAFAFWLISEMRADINNKAQDTKNDEKQSDQ